MSNFILSDDLTQAETTVVTAAETALDLGPERLKQSQLLRNVRLTGGTKRLTIDLGADKTIAALALNSAWFTTFLPILPDDRIIIAIDADGGTPGAGAVWGFDGPAGVIEYLGFQAWLLSSSVTGRYVHLVVDRSAAVDICRLGIYADIKSTAFNVDYSFEDGADDSSIGETTELANATFWEVGETSREWPLAWQKLTELERAMLRRMRHQFGITQPFVFGLFNDTALIPEFSMFCQFTSLPGFKPVKGGDWIARAQIKEIN